MSRSYRKGYSSSYRGDKECRKEYHRSVRRKIRSLLKDELKFIDDGDNLRPSEKITSKGRDFGCKSADPWSWPSDGRQKFQHDLQTLRREFNEALKEQSYSYNVWYSPWKDYQEFRDAKFTSIYYDLSYKVVIGWHKEAHDDWYFDPNEDDYRFRHYHHHWTTWEPTFREVSKHLDHYPLMSDLEPGAVQVSVNRSWKQPVRYCQASYDGALIDFLFHRNMIPNNFTSEEQLMKWLYQNNEKIVRSWYKVLYSK